MLFQDFFKSCHQKPSKKCCYDYFTSSPGLLLCLGATKYSVCCNQLSSNHLLSVLGALITVDIVVGVAILVVIVLEVAVDWVYWVVYWVVSTFVVVVTTAVIVAVVIQPN